MQKMKELIKLSNFQLFASRTSSVKFRVFRREFLPNHSMNRTQIFGENLNCYALSIFRVLILLASSDRDKEKLNEAKSVNKDSPIDFNLSNTR